MEDSAAVLFIVTIPTEAEESRLKAEFIARKLDIRSDQIDISTLSATLPTTTTNGVDKKSASNQAETASTTNTIFDSNTPLTTHKEYDTFPKRRRLSDTDTVNHVTFRRKPNEAGDGNGGGGGGGSFEQVDLELDETPFLPRKSVETLSSNTETKSNNIKRISSVDLETPSDTCMEKIVKEILKKFQVTNAVWTQDSQGHKHQIIFTIEFNEVYEKILEKFYEWGIGDREGSSVSVMNCIVAKAYTEADEVVEAEAPKNKENVNAQSAWERFMNSVQSRLNVSQLIRDVRQNASITFDFIILVISASILAAFGLNEDSVVFLAASMLISPLMGPIIASVFGTAIKDRSLGLLGLKNELLGLLLATSVGFIFGLIVCTFDKRYSVGDGITQEMLSRCEIHSLIVGIFTAIPSGAAVAVGILGGNIGSLVGVAISASLLPPAVNSGLLWALALLYKIFEKDGNRFPEVIKSHVYSDNQATELAVMGFLSMCLTISNIICVYLMGVLVLRVKEIAPIGSTNKEFWKRDIKVARVLGKTGDIDPNEAIINEFSNLPKEDQKALGLDSDLLRKIHSLDDSNYQNTWSPIGNQCLYETRYEPRQDNYTTVHQLERLYSTIHRQSDYPADRRSRLSQRRTRRDSEMAGVSYKLLAEKRPRLSTLERGFSNNIRFSVLNSPTLNEESSEIETSKVTSDEPKGRKFIVTPASEDSLNSRSTKDK